MYTYQQYTEDLDYLEKLDQNNLLQEGVVGDVLDGMKGKLGKLLLQVKDTLSKASITTKDLIVAFKDRNIFSLLKFVKWSATGLFNMYQKADTMIKNGVLKPFEILAKNSNLVKKLQKGGSALDNFLSDHPILKKLTGPLVAGILLYIWLNMTFVGSLDYDFNFTTMLSALVGTFSIEDIFTTPQGISMLTFLLTGVASGGVLSVPWIGHTVGNLILALSYTALKNKKIEQEKLKKLKGFMK
jgi:hypothetical protein